MSRFSFSSWPRGARLCVVPTIAVIAMCVLLSQAEEKKPSTAPPSFGAGDKAPSKSAESAAAEKAIRAAVQSYVEAYNKGDAKTLAEHWAADAEWVNPAGERFQGRKAIQEAMEAMFAESKGVTIEVLDTSVRLIMPEVALEEGAVRVNQPGQPPSDASYIAVHSKKNGQWKLESVRETGLPEVQPHLHLKQLEWLVGEWIDESPDAVVEQKFRWSDDGHYLLGSFVVQWQGKHAIKGDVRIGWDPLARQLKSWIFDSEGGVAEGLWTKVEDRWVVKLSGARADGTIGSATVSYIPIRKDRYEYTSVDRLVGGQQEPDKSVIIVRKPPEPKL